MLLDVQGEVYRPTDPDYWAHAYQYATSSHIDDMDMRPGTIVYPTGDKDVQNTIAYAKCHKLAIAIRSGGHQYCGASSTGQQNVLLDMKHAYHKVGTDFVIEEPPKANPTDRQEYIAKVGVSFQLWDVNQMLKEKHLFVPHGQCSHVHVGGHAHTGGYGQLSRAFGLFGDHILKIRIITADQKIHEIARDTKDKLEQDLFWAVLGGSPGNFAVLTHVWLSVLHDDWFPDSRGMKYIVPLGYKTEKNLVDLLHIIADMADDDDFDPDFDLCISVISGGKLSTSAEGSLVAEKWDIDVNDLDNLMHQQQQQVFGNAHIQADPRMPYHMILIYAQWANLKGAAQPYEASPAKAWFDRIKAAIGKQGFQNVPTPQGIVPQVPYLPVVDYDKHTPMSILTGMWVMKDVREYDSPYIKRTFCTNWSGQQLRASGWAEFTADQLYARSYDPTDGCRVVSQIQPFNGKYSRFATLDPHNQTSYSWRRELTVVSVMDCFYDPKDPEAIAAKRNPKEIAKLWQHVNDVMHVGGDDPIFCDKDIRVLWGSHASKPEEYNMGVSWNFYHETKAKYDRLKEIKRRVDPNNIFTPNPFCVGVDPKQKFICGKKKDVDPASLDVKHAAAARKRAATHQLK